MPKRVWGHNLHYHPVLLSSVPAGATRVLDVGCGDGRLARELRRRGLDVVALDADEPILEVARSHPDAGGIEFVHGDVLTHPFAPGSFDAVVSVATLHHLDTAAGLARFGELVRPGGVVVVVGLARSRHPMDGVYDVGGMVASRVRRIAHGPMATQPAPMMWPPPHSYRDVRRIAEDVLPGSVYRRRLYFRYTITWRRPTVDD